MRSASAIDSERVGPRRIAGGLVVALLLGLLAGLLAACGGSGSGRGAARDERTVLTTRKGDSSIQVTESEIDGNQIIRIRTVFRGEENSIVLDIDQPVYEVEIPLTLEQVIPQAGSAQARGPEGQFQDLMIAQWLQKAQEAMVAGDYSAALRQVDTVLQVQPNHIQGHIMKGSVYYALGNYELANEEWEYVLTQDPSNREVLEFQEFLRNRPSGQAPNLPGAPAGTTAPTAPPAAAPRSGTAPGGGTAPAPPAGGPAR